MCPGTYLTNFGRMRSVMHRRQLELNVSLALSKDLNKWRVPVTTPSTNSDDCVARRIMDTILRQHKIIIKRERLLSHSFDSSPSPSPLTTQPPTLDVKKLNELIPSVDTRIDDPIQLSDEVCPLLTNHIDTSHGDLFSIASINQLMISAPIPIFKFTTSVASLHFKVFLITNTKTYCTRSASMENIMSTSRPLSGLFRLSLLRPILQPILAERQLPFLRSLCHPILHIPSHLLPNCPTP